MWVIAENGRTINLENATHIEIIEREGRAYVCTGLMDGNTFEMLKCNSVPEAQDAIYDLMIMRGQGSKFVNLCEPLAERQLAGDEDE